MTQGGRALDAVDVHAYHSADPSRPPDRLDEELLDEELCELCDELELLLEDELGLLGGALLLEEDEDELGILGDDELELEVL